MKKEKTLAEGILKDIDAAIKHIRGMLRCDDLKGSVGDLVRLLQLRQELTKTQPRQLTVRWVDECQTPTKID